MKFEREQLMKQIIIKAAALRPQTVRHFDEAWRANTVDKLETYRKLETLRHAN